MVKNWCPKYMNIITSARFLAHYNEYYDKIYRYLYYRSNQNSELAEDLTADTFLKAFEKFETYDSSRPFSAWIYRIAHNHLIDNYRQHEKRATTSLDQNEIDIPIESNVSLSINQQLTHDQLVDYLQHLPENLQEILILKYFNDHTNKEIEILLELNPNTLRTRIHRALKMLRQVVPNSLLLLCLLLSKIIFK
jgi:RNA polymerase sigma-70 factor (ECF subfamily)